MKKLLILIILVAAGYIGYLVWNNLNDQEKAAVKDQVHQATEKTKDLAKSAADKVTGKTKEIIHENLIDDIKSTPNGKGNQNP